jgi:glycosyltransferase involved in cell wall biosynthesis
MNKLLENIKPDVIHLHGSLIYAYLTKPNRKAHICSTMHAIPTGDFKKHRWLSNIFPVFAPKIQKSNCHFIDKVPNVFSISTSVQDVLLSKYGINSTVVYNGINTKAILSKTNKSKPVVFKLLQMGRFNFATKAQDLTVMMASKLDANFTVDLMGKGQHDSNLRSLIEQEQLGNKCHLIGTNPQSYVFEHLKDYDIFLLPSRREGFGLTVAEAMAAGVPVVLSSGHGAEEVTCGNKYGWVFKNGDIDDYANTVKYVISHYEEAIAKAELARQYVIQKFDVSTTAQNYLNQYKTLK